MAKKWLLGLGVLCLLAILLSGCVPLSDYETLKTTHQSLQADHKVLQDEYASLQANYEGLQAKCPLRDFATYGELTSWARDHKQPVTPYIDGSFQSALRVQNAGLEDGYLINVEIDLGENTYMATVDCTAFVNGQLYYWHPEDGEVYSWAPYFPSTFQR